MNHDEMSVRIENVEVRQDKLEKRQDNLEQLTNAFAKMETEQSYIKKDVGEIKADVKALAEKPAKRWESIVEKAITFIVAAVVGFLLSGGTM
ncbi:hypothetical protein [Anaerotignum propionicum]|uniref:Hemolysin XhlA n=1 Tax=Anaerotignum propionicum DSM 1682 TaxID=991789 RepID=A0A0X8VEI7_ANAPI|nr:hypothetical protein [Anaerotignum propionicum]AMJ41682.1 hypothetical protein CPRO_21020 [Anaerotignum propionicum DSM 1682]AMJ42319.1 hypothetical protein CPRO_27730 [Anaerotignum propionicum DSM 1682]SHE56261.1 hypothetical protein SAMN02745151_01138 [[Clostridium] propionicum DSM 1682] [Anaerotignum propionicum DSM 1682]SHE88960.1 hypothetical protein SAMN02745151_02123 [[Clostridium] propionicum DSM 1682] [Anaerotignum propionicum DSM 1682]